jgi:hypothetical protein
MATKFIKKKDHRLAYFSMLAPYNEIKNSNIKSFLKNPSPNKIYELLKGQNWILFSKVLLK